ncbi:hypothetical protein [Streptomyces sp. NPDC056663]|uniref:hypothetical protein n=1 Tax=Streptomyces sp. NPDC056663 TaxID=3345899 RepID=UPI0036AA0010
MSDADHHEPFEDRRLLVVSSAVFATSSPSGVAREAVVSPKYRHSRDLRQNGTTMYCCWHNPSHDD